MKIKLQQYTNEEIQNQLSLMDNVFDASVFRYRKKLKQITAGRGVM